MTMEITELFTTQGKRVASSNGGAPWVGSGKRVLFYVADPWGRAVPYPLAASEPLFSEGDNDLINVDLSEWFRKVSSSETAQQGLRTIEDSLLLWHHLSMKVVEGESDMMSFGRFDEWRLPIVNLDLVLFDLQTALDAYKKDWQPPFARLLFEEDYFSYLAGLWAWGELYLADSSSIAKGMSDQWRSLAKEIDSEIALLSKVGLSYMVWHGERMDVLKKGLGRATEEKALTLGQVNAGFLETLGVKGDR